MSLEDAEHALPNSVFGTYNKMAWWQSANADCATPLLSKSLSILKRFFSDLTCQCYQMSIWTWKKYCLFSHYRDRSALLSSSNFFSPVKKPSIIWQEKKKSNFFFIPLVYLYHISSLKRDQPAALCPFNNESFTKYITLCNSAACH